MPQEVKTMYLRIDDIFPDGITGDGVFSALQATEVPWKDENISTSLDTLYHGNHGARIISPLVKKLLDTDNTLSSANKTKLATAIYNLYSEKWTKLWNTLSLEYNPINNYDMEERETPAEITRTITPAETTETVTPAETTQTVTPAETTETVTPAETTETVTPAETTETVTPAETTVNEKPAKTVQENTVSAFNSLDYVDDTKTTITGDDEDKGVTSIDVDSAGTNKLEVDSAGTNKLEVDSAGTNKLEVDSAGTNKLEVDTAGSNKLEVDTAGTNKLEVDTAGSEIITVQNERVLTRSGNIGVTTSQQMIQSERDLWQWNFFESVFTDLDYVLTLQIY